MTSLKRYALALSVLLMAWPAQVGAEDPPPDFPRSVEVVANSENNYMNISCSAVGADPQPTEIDCTAIITQLTYDTRADPAALERQWQDLRRDPKKLRQARNEARKARQELCAPGVAETLRQRQVSYVKPYWPEERRRGVVPSEEDLDRLKQVLATFCGPCNGEECTHRWAAFGGDAALIGAARRQCTITTSTISLRMRRDGTARWTEVKPVLGCNLETLFALERYFAADGKVEWSYSQTRRRTAPNVVPPHSNRFQRGLCQALSHTDVFSFNSEDSIWPIDMSQCRTVDFVVTD